MIRILALNAYYVPAFRGGGPIRTIEAMVSEHKEALSFKIVTSDRDLGVAERLPGISDGWNQVGYAKVYYARASPIGRLRGLHTIRTTPADYLYLNSLFAFWFSILPVALGYLRLNATKKIVVAPRGELGEGALVVRRPKKLFFLRLAKASGAYRNVTWHASSQQEADEIGSYFPKATILVRQNEVMLPSDPVENRSNASGNFRAVYIGRISEKKGLHTLLEALQQLDVPAHLDVFGAFEDGNYEKRLRVLVDALPPHVRVQFLGPLEHSSVRETFRNYHAFLFPTNHENFGHTIAESLSSSCPVVVANVTPFTSNVLSGGGVIVEPHSTSGWLDAVRELATESAFDRRRRFSQAKLSYRTWRAESSGASVFELIENSKSDD